MKTKKDKAMTLKLRGAQDYLTRLRKQHTEKLSTKTGEDRKEYIYKMYRQDYRRFGDYPIEIKRGLLKSGHLDLYLREVYGRYDLREYAQMLLNILAKEK